VVSADDKILAKTIWAAFGAKPRIIRYRDDTNTLFVDIACVQDRPEEGTASYSTVAFSNNPLFFNGNATSLRVELLGICGNEDQQFANLISTICFVIIRNKFFCEPGTILSDVIDVYYPNLGGGNMKHILFGNPVFWNLETMRLPSKTVAWVLCVPITETERQYADEHGVARLEERLEECDANVANLSRNSVV
jgi:hypothetical protein